MRWHALGLLRLLGRRRESRTALSSAASHDSTKQIPWSMAYLRGLGLRGAAVVGVLAGSTTCLEFALKLGDPVFIFRLDLIVLLLKGVDLAADQFNFLDMAGNLSFVINAALGLGLELGPNAVEEFVQALTWPSWRAAHARGVVIHACRMILEDSVLMNAGLALRK
jgi:hypothetical protein